MRTYALGCDNSPLIPRPLPTSPSSFGSLLLTALCSCVSDSRRSCRRLSPTGASSDIPSGSSTHQQIDIAFDLFALSLARPATPAAPNLYRSPLDVLLLRPSIHSAASAETSLGPSGSLSSQTASGFAPRSASSAAACLASGTDSALSD